MYIRDLLKKESLSISFEVFPPKNDTAVESVMQAACRIAALRPAYISVTYGAGGGQSKYTMAMAQRLQKEYGVPTVAHLTCVSSTRETIRTRMEEITALGIENVLALRGDLPADQTASDPLSWSYHHAIELVRELKQFRPDFCIGGACYPETHPEAANSRDDIRYLKEKVDAGCDFLTTQMFFDNSLLYSFLYRIREAGISVPVIPGIMPITNANQLKRAIELSRSFMPVRFLRLVDRFGSDAEAMKQAGIIYATDQIIDLYASGIRHVHVYTMNNPDVAFKIIDNLSAILGSVSPAEGSR